MASLTRGDLKSKLSQVVSYDGGNQMGKNQGVLVDSIRDIEVIDGSGGNVTLSAAQSGGVVFAGGGARTITLPAVATGLNYKIVSTTAHNHIVSCCIYIFVNPNSSNYIIVQIMFLSFY